METHRAGCNRRARHPFSTPPHQASQNVTMVPLDPRTSVQKENPPMPPMPDPGMGPQTAAKRRRRHKNNPTEAGHAPAYSERQLCCPLPVFCQWRARVPAGLGIRIGCRCDTLETALLSRPEKHNPRKRGPRALQYPLYSRRYYQLPTTPHHLDPLPPPQ